MADINVDRLIVQIEARTKQFEGQLKKLEGQVKGSNQRMEKSFSGLSSKIASTGKTLLASFGIGVGIGALAQLPGLLMGVADAVGGIGEKAAQAGISMRELQELTFAGTGVGIGEDRLVAQMGKFTDLLAEARNKGGDLKKILDANNVSLVDANGQVRSTVEMFREVADLVKNAANEQDRMTIATAAFGDRMGREMLPLLKEGGDAIKEMQVQAHELGAVISDEMIAKADAFSDAWAQAWYVFSVRARTTIVEVGSWLSEFLARQKWPWGSPMFPGMDNLSGSGGGDFPGGGPMNDPLNPWRPTVIPPFKAPSRSPSSASRSLSQASSEFAKAAGAVKTAADDVIKAQEAMRKSMMDLGEMGVNALTAIAIRGEKASEVFRNLALSMAEAVVQASLLGQGPLAGLFGTGTGGGLLGQLIGGIGGGSPSGAGAAGAAAKTFGLSPVLVRRT